MAELQLDPPGAAQAVALRERTVAQCVEAIRARNVDLRAVLHVLPEPEDPGVPQGALAGVPYVLKDVWDTAGVRTTGGSWRHRDRVPPVSSRIHLALRRTGAVMLGKSNLADLAFSIESDNHLFGPVRNPHDLSRTAGGSTGGGACAVAAGMAAFEWGTDFGGSIRLPAAFCGVVGLRLSAETWSVDREHFPRIAPRFWSFCGMGPLTRTVAGAREVVEALAPELRRKDPRPSIDPDRVLLYAPDEAHRGAWPSFEGDALGLLDRAGLRVDRAHALPSPRHVAAVFDRYLCAHFADFIGREELPLAEGVVAAILGLVTRGKLDRRIHPASGALLALAGVGRLVYRDADRETRALEALRASVRDVWRSGRLIVAPTTTSLPPRHGRAALALRAPTFAKLGNLADATAVALPFGRFAGTSLPRSLQVLGPPGSEHAVLALAARLERLTRQSSKVSPPIS